MCPPSSRTRRAVRAARNSAQTIATEHTAGSKLFIISITLGLRPGEPRMLTWGHVDLNREVIHVWRSASTRGDAKAPKSKRSLELPKRAIAALTM
jgi:integrase